jgi:hypothetical protein
MAQSIPRSLVLVTPNKIYGNSITASTKRNLIKIVSRKQPSQETCRDCPFKRKVQFSANSVALKFEWAAACRK